MTKLFECYVAIPTHDEAVEIVERLVANGANARSVVVGMGIDGNGCNHDEYGLWGYNSNYGTYAGRLSFDWATRAKQLTMPEFRAAFPCEKYDGVTKEWDVEGLPPTVWHGEVSWGIKALWYECVSLPKGKLAICKYSEWSVSDIENYDLVAFRPLSKPKSDREKFIEAAVEAVGGRQAVISTDSVFGKLYDAGFKAPEKDND